MSSEKSIDSISSDPARYSTKVNSLLNFLDQIDDLSDDITSGTVLREISGVSSSKFSLTCHADTTNYLARSTSRICEDEKKVDESIKPRSSNPHLLHEKKYIWDEWDEVIKDPFHQKKYIWDDDEMAKLDEETKYLWNDLEGTVEDVDEQVIDENTEVTKDEIVEVKDAVPDKQSKRCPVDTRQQLQLLKSMSEEIQARADAMRLQLEQKTREVEELHSIRVKNEAEHVQKMISVKQEWKQRIEDVTAEHEKASDSLRSHDRVLLFCL